MSVVFEGEDFKSFEPKDSRFPASTVSVTLVGCNIRSLENFPQLDAVKKIDLSDNRIKEGLEHLVSAAPNVEILSLGGNYLKTFEAIEPLFKLTKLRKLDLSICAVSELEGFSEKVFAAIPTLEALNNLDKEGKEVDDEDEEEYEEGNPEEDEYEEDDEDGEEGFDFSKMLNADEAVSDGDDDDFVPENEEEEDDDIASDEDVAEEQ